MLVAKICGCLLVANNFVGRFNPNASVIGCQYDVGFSYRQVFQGLV